MNARTGSADRKPRAVAKATPAACTECPVCGSEECLMLEELGNYCATMAAASLAKKEEPARRA